GSRRSRPSWVELAPYTPDALRGWEAGGSPGQCLPRTGDRTPYRAWMALPGCALVAEVDVSTAASDPDGILPAEVTRALRFTPTGVEVVSDVSIISCPFECQGEPILNLDLGADDGGVDGGSRLPTTQAQPATVALDVENGTTARLFVGDRTGERIT